VEAKLVLLGFHQGEKTGGYLKQYANYSAGGAQTKLIQLDMI